MVQESRLGGHLGKEGTSRHQPAGGQPKGEGLETGFLGHQEKPRAAGSSREAAGTRWDAEGRHTWRALRNFTSTARFTGTCWGRGHFKDVAWGGPRPSPDWQLRCQLHAPGGLPSLPCEPLSPQAASAAASSQLRGPALLTREAARPLRRQDPDAPARSAPH